MEDRLAHMCRLGQTMANGRWQLQGLWPGPVVPEPREASQMDILTLLRALGRRQGSLGSGPSADMGIRRALPDLR